MSHHNRLHAVPSLTNTTTSLSSNLLRNHHDNTPPPHLPLDTPSPSPSPPTLPPVPYPPPILHPHLIRPLPSTLRSPPRTDHPRSAPRHHPDPIPQPAFRAQRALPLPAHPAPQLNHRPSDHHLLPARRIRPSSDPQLCRAWDLLRWRRSQTALYVHPRAVSPSRRPFPFPFLPYLPYPTLPCPSIFLSIHPSLSIHLYLSIKVFYQPLIYPSIYHCIDLLIPLYLSIYIYFSIEKACILTIFPFHHLTVSYTSVPSHKSYLTFQLLPPTSSHHLLPLFSYLLSLTSYFSPLISLLYPLTPYLFP